jgi:hypothetical protein
MPSPLVIAHISPQSPEFVEKTEFGENVSLWKTKGDFYGEKDVASDRGKCTLDPTEDEKLLQSDAITPLPPGRAAPSSTSR